MPLRLKALDAVDWASMTDGCDSPQEIPELLSAVWSPDPAMRRWAYESLVHHLVHQGSRFDASVAAVPFLIDVVADPVAPDRYLACSLLRVVALGDELYWLTELPEPGRSRAEVARLAGLSREELEQERAAWVVAADEGERRAREMTAIMFDVEVDREGERWNMEAYDAVRAGVPTYVAALTSADPALRLWAAYLLAWFPEEQGTIVPALIQVIRADQEPVVAATACVAAGLCGAPGDAALIDALSTRRGSGSRGERWSAVLGLARVVLRPDRALLDELFECLFGAVAQVPDWPFLDGDMASVAALTVARLGEDTATERVEILASWLGQNSASVDPYMAVEALLEAAFPDGGVAAGAAFGDLSEAQRAAVSALDRPVVWGEGAMVSMLLGEYGLPGDAAALRRWMAAHASDGSSGKYAT